MIQTYPFLMPFIVYIDQSRHLRTGFHKRLFISYQDQGVKKSGFENPNVILHKKPSSITT